MTKAERIAEVHKKYWTKENQLLQKLYDLKQDRDAKIRAIEEEA